jgi:hypothetical protein
MPPGRNDPCPCGSGRKYKVCCQFGDASQARDRAAAVSPSRRGAPRRGPHRTEVLEGIRKEVEWAADAFALPIAVADIRSPRPVAVLVTAGDLVVHTDILGSLRGEPAAVAEALERGLTSAAGSAAGSAGAWPERVVVRHAEVAAELGPRLRGQEVAVEVGDAPGLAAAATSLLDHMAGWSLWPPPCTTERWRGWDLPGSLVGELFDAAADFYRVAPWTVVENLQAPRALLPAGRSWSCCVMGAGGDEFGLAMYGDPEDFARTATRGLAGGLAGMAGPVVSVTFDRVREVPAAAMHEVRTNGWKLAGPAAYPRLMTINTPGGGVSEACAQDLLLLLRALPAWADAHADELCQEAESRVPMAATRWTHAATGVVLEYAGTRGLFDDEEDEIAGAGRPVLSPEIQEELQEIVADVRRELGPDVSSDAFSAEVNRRIAPVMGALNSRPQAELGGLSPDQVRALLTADWEDPTGVVRLNRELGGGDVASAPFVANARLLLEAGLDTGALPATQSGNLKPALVGTLLPRMAWVDARAAVVSREYHTRTQEGDHRELHRLRVVCEQAGLITRRSLRYDLDDEARRLVHPGHAGNLLARLFVAWFRRFNLAYGTAWAWPELQHQLAFTFHRLPAAAREWRTADQLLDDVVLPFALDALLDREEGRSDASSALEILVLNELAGFGLLERGVQGGGRRLAPTVSFRAAPLLSRFFRVQW